VYPNAQDPTTRFIYAEKTLSDPFTSYLRHESTFDLFVPLSVYPNNLERVAA